MDHVKDFVWSFIAAFSLAVFFYNAYALLFTQQGGVDNLVYIVLSTIAAMAALMMDGR